MSVNAIEKHAQALNQALRVNGKQFGKTWRLRIRDLLAQTFAAMNAKPLDGALCKSLDEKMEAELAAIENGTVAVESSDTDPKPKKKKASKASADSPTAATETEELPEFKPAEQPATMPESVAMPEPEPVSEPAVSDDVQADPTDSVVPEAARMDEGHSDAEGEPRMDEGHSGAGDASPDTDKKTIPVDEIGLFDLIHIEIRCFFTIRACVRPPYIGQFVTFSEQYADDVQARIDRFLGVLSKGEDDFAAKTDVEVGYRDDLLPNMPERGLILYPKKKKKH